MSAAASNPLSSGETRTRNVWAGASMVALFFLCCMTRLYDLGWKAIMHDETLFVFYTYFQLYREWTYQYLPILHGPTMMQLQALVFHLFGASDYTMRLGVALLGVGGFFWVWQIRHWLGRTGTWIALAFYSLSPGITCFQRFYHMDSLYLFNSLWIIASLANWWRTKSPRWAASAVLGSVVLFSTKASALFVFFSVVTFALLLFLNDVAGWVLKGREFARVEFVSARARFPNPLVMALVLWCLTVLVITQVFEGIRYDNDVVQAIGHDWVLRDVRSIPLAMGWERLSETSAPDAGVARSGSFWRGAYAGVFVALLAGCWVLRICVEKRIGAREWASALWARMHAARWHLLGALVLGCVLYHALFTMFFAAPLGFFEIYAKTWAYWGGQHEWGRIRGPFHMHLLNMVVYEMPSVLVVVAVWFAGLWRTSWSRLTSLAFFLIVVAVGGFHVLLFKGLQHLPADAIGLMPLRIDVLRNIFLGGALLGSVLFLVPRGGRMLFPAAFLALAGYLLFYFSGRFWSDAMNSIIYRDGVKVILSNRPVTLADFMEIQFNFDGGSSIAIVVLLIFFATVHAWSALERGARFEAFLVWWLVTAAGAASYAREAVPQVGIHAMLPLILLASLYLDRLSARVSGGAPRLAFMAGIGLFMAWNAKASFNLNFRNADDARERMVYGHTPPQVLQQANFIRDYRAIAPIRMADANTSAWIRSNNDPTQEKDLRVGIQSDGVIWQMRWYLRDVEWRESKNLQEFIDGDYDFIFADDTTGTTPPQLEEKYHVFKSCAIRFWLPRPLSAERLVNTWELLIPGHYLDESPQSMEAYNAKLEWRKVWRYLMLRETFDGGTDEGGGTMSATTYLFCVRRDLY